MRDEPEVYIFDKLKSPLQEDLKIPTAFGGDINGYANRSAWNKLTFSLGGSGSGMMFHEHEAAWTALFTGAKRWLIWDQEPFLTLVVINPMTLI